MYIGVICMCVCVCLFLEYRDYRKRKNFADNVNKEYERLHQAHPELPTYVVQEMAATKVERRISIPAWICIFFLAPFVLMIVFGLLFKIYEAIMKIVNFFL